MASYMLCSSFIPVRASRGTPRSAFNFANEILQRVSPPPGWNSHPGSVDIAVPDGGSPHRIAALGKRRQHEVSFPHHLFEQVPVGENSLQLYAYGRDLYDAMLEAIDAAHESIYLETYIWKDDAVGQEFQERLARKAEQGVAVYVIFDSFGNLVVPRAFKSSFHPAIHVLEYRAIRRPWHLLDPHRYALDHRELLIVDGITSFIGATTWARYMLLSSVTHI